MRGAATAGGEWTDAAAERGMEIIGDVVSEWKKFASEEDIVSSDNCALRRDGQTVQRGRSDGGMLHV